MRVRRPLNSKLQYISSVEWRKEYKKGKKVFEFYNGTPVVQYNILWAITSYILMQYSFFVTNKTKSKADDTVVRVFVSETN